MTWILAGVIVGLLLAPHLLPQARLTPLSGIALWLSALFLRAVLALLVTAVVVVYLPTTQLFGLITHWCIHAVLPFFSSHLGFSGHQAGDLASLIPILMLCLSALSVAFGLWRAARAVRRRLSSSALGTGPGESVIVGGDEIIVAVAGLRVPRVVVSAGALVYLDEAELVSSLQHERGHIDRYHRFVVLAAQLAFALARLVPGSQRALLWVHFHLERDADHYAIERTGDPLALASAICKAATARQPSSPAWAGLGGKGGVASRLKLLLADLPPASSLSVAASRVLAVTLVSAALALAASGPAVARTGLGQGASPAAYSCQR